jgi:hypothetical protein
MVTALVQHMSQQLGVVGGGVARNLLVPNADVQQSSVKLNENKRKNRGKKESRVNEMSGSWSTHWHPAVG